ILCRGGPRQPRDEPWIDSGFAEPAAGGEGAHEQVRGAGRIARVGAELAAAYAAADVFVFPSKTDTFGLVMIEALASGVPVAAFPVTGPVDVLKPGVGVMDDDLDAAIAAALTLDRSACAAYGRTFTWEASARQFLEALAPIALVGDEAIAA
ncbi:MAG: glycosyltransferase, partial [Sphingomonas sp.]|nr:glycosyltransferase [Sphingomonas sp.]